MLDLVGRTAFITGGAQGIGLGIAKALVGAGVNVALADVNESAVEQAKASLPSPAPATTHALDVRDRAAFARAADAAERERGPVSLVFNNAGVSGRVLVEDMSFE